MSHAAPSSSGSEPLFCQRNNRLWVMSLVGSAVFVLVLALWLALKDGKLRGWRHGAPPSASHGNTHPQTAVAAPTPTPATDMTAAGQQVALGAGQATRGPLSPTPAPGTGTMGAMPSPSPSVGSGTASRLQRSFNQVAERLRPTVVNITAARPGAAPAQPQNGNAARFIDPFDGVPDKVVGGVALESVGTGVIIDPRGYIVTNDHLITGATHIMVSRFHDDNAIPATLITTDPTRDLALLKVDGGNLPAAKLANSSGVTVGDWVLAIGNPFGLGHSVTAGIVSSRRSSVLIAGVRYKNLLQTDAPINQGSSGGPLVNLEGKVVGINTAIYAPTGVFNGTGFAIPSNQVGAFVARAMTENPHPPARAAAIPSPAPGPTAVAQPSAPTAGAGWIGVHATSVTAPLAQKLELASATGVFVNAVDPGSPAESAGLRRGDVILSVGGRPMTDAAALSQTMQTLAPGMQVKVQYARKGATRTADLLIAPMRAGQ